MDDQPASKGFYIKFSPSDPRDVQLSHWIKADTEARTVNVSGVIKQLLYAWYEQRWRLGRLPAPSVGDFTGMPALPSGNGHQHALPASHHSYEEFENPGDPLVQAMVGISFDEL